MTTVIGLTGGIGSGKSTILKYIKTLKIPIHDSDGVVKDLYKKPNKEFLRHLSRCGLNSALKKREINKKIVREEVFKNKTKLKMLEKFIHKKVKESRNKFIKSNKKKQKELVVVDIPLLYENKLEKICNHVLLAYCPKTKRFKRVLRRKDMNKKTLENILSSQMSDKEKLSKKNFVINTSKGKSFSNLQTLKAIKKIKLLKKLKK